MLAHKTWRIEDTSPATDAADAAPEQMKSFVQSMTEVFEKIEESLRTLCMVEDLNDDEIMELCILSNELNACETTALLNSSKFVSHTTRLRLREGFAVDLTLARANGTMWDLSLEDDREELRRVQKREQPELLAGSPPSDDFYSFLNTCVRELSHRSELAYKLISCGWKCRSTSSMNIPKIPRPGKRFRFNFLSATQECTVLMVRCVAGA